MKTSRVLLVSVLCLVLILTSLPVMSSCKAKEPSGYSFQTGLGGGISSAVLQVVLGDLASGVLSWAGGKGSEFVFGLITGSQDKTGQDLKDIKDKLGQMDQKLDQLQEDIRQIRDKVNTMAARLEIMQWDQAIGTVVSKISVIEATFDKVRSYSEEAKKEEVDISKYRDKVTTLSKEDGDILSSSHGVWQAVDELDKLIMGFGGKTPLLELLRQRVSAKLQSSNRLESYAYLESFFMGLVGIELKGVELIINAYAATDEPGLADTYLKSFYEDKLKPQVEKFASCVEELIWTNDHTKWTEVIMDVNRYIFPQADQLVDALLGGYYVENGQLRVGKEEGAHITARVRYEGTAPPLTTLKVLNTDTGQSFESTPQSTRANVLKYDFGPVPPGQYRVVTQGHEAILHDYGEKIIDMVKMIDITEGREYGYIGIYAWAPDPNQYYRITPKHTDKHITVDSFNFGYGTSQIASPFAGRSRWKFEHVGDGWYKVINKHSGGVLEIADFRKDSGATICHNEWHGGNNERWRLHLLEGGYYKIVSMHSGKVLDVKGGSENNGTPILQGTWQGGDSQRWKLTPKAKDDSPWFKIKAKHASAKRGKSMLLDVYGAGKYNGANIWLYPDNNTKAQQWKLEYVKGGGFRLTPRHDSKMCADVQGGSTKNDTSVHLWEYKKKTSQKWSIQHVGGGYYRFINENSRKVLDVLGYGTHDGANVGQWSWKNKDNQKWKLVKTK